MGLKRNFFTLPKETEAEITLIGTGGGYGESMVVRVGRNWIIVDSCINPKTKDVLPLQYLEEIGANLNDVSLVICTHWHNDHIRGLSHILEVCENAKFIVPRVNDKDKFVRFITLDSEKEAKGGFSSIDEFGKCLELSVSKKIKVVRASSNQVLGKIQFNVGGNDLGEFEIDSLSPSESVVAHFDRELGALLDKRFSVVSVPEKGPNDKSVVILIKHKKFSALLGADLEVKENQDQGWHDIINNCLMFNTKPVIYKLPHHGSQNGYHEDIFKNIIGDNAILKLTPWNRGSKLPELEMLKKYREHSTDLFITSPVHNNQPRPKARSKSLHKMAELFSKNLSEMKFELGIVRSRIDLSDSHPMVSVELFGSAFKVAD
ncbi:MBL fold metallo-hydrolase [Flagellimonas alvinocaridis]|uniref:MBL fold metallo-hydrolase n=1 Tax=Flagellimonas alvinocaridis TaxID=2530200 RepID=A0A4S8RSG6_9FLAO|nr:MBL fold metallo-hydrolase [Allomuricauda alvinocaridis]THV61673.1 MBL fold metallo-hydrolase [Allomuricauda alvinocaridis]